MYLHTFFKNQNTLLALLVRSAFSENDNTILALTGRSIDYNSEMASFILNDTDEEQKGINEDNWNFLKRPIDCHETETWLAFKMKNLVYNKSKDAKIFFSVILSVALGSSLEHSPTIWKNEITKKLYSVRRDPILCAWTWVTSHLKPLSNKIDL